MRYAYLEITDEEREGREKRDAGKKILHCKGKNEHEWVTIKQPKEDASSPPMPMPGMSCGVCNVSRKEWMQAINLKDAAFGERELLSFFVGEQVELKGKKEFRVFDRIMKILDDGQDPGWIKLEEDDWTWLISKLSEDINLNQEVKDQGGQEMQRFGIIAKKAFCRILVKLEDAQDKIPDALLPKAVEPDTLPANG